jgi:hypothetical protein
VPKVGPFSGLAFHPPTPVVEQLYMSSFNKTLDHYRALLLAQQERRLQLPNDNLDTGAVTGAATYRLADETYAKLLDKTSHKPVSEALRRDLLSYYADLQRPFATKRNSKAWHELIKQLDILKSTTVVGISLSTDSFNLSLLKRCQHLRHADSIGADLPRLNDCCRIAITLMEPYGTGLPSVAWVLRGSQNLVHGIYS